jgi:hypothetical protein
MQQVIQKHKWASGGVSTYPLTHPIVGQSRFFNTFKQFIHLVDDESEKFAHVFAVVAQWGVGKSRLGYELISQINDTSPGWFVRDNAGALIKAALFNDDTDRKQYLGLYIRYSQVANENNNVDNWFAFGLYHALLPLATAEFDNSIQGQIAKEAYDHLLVAGFDERELAKALEIDRNHDSEILYDDPLLLTRLCEAAYAYLNRFGIKYFLVVMDELETVAEASTYGLEVEDIKRLDGRAIKLVGKAIKEEDPRRKLPWLRYVALCSPAIGDELRDIKSTARRFEIEELSQNGFSDVSDFVEALRSKQRLPEEYPEGLVEAAYAMSGGNFGWFNVIMANADEGLRSIRRQRENEKDSKKEGAAETPLPTLGELFEHLVQSSSRIREYVLDHNALSEINFTDKRFRNAARELLYGQLPVSLNDWQVEERAALLTAQNEYDEPVAMLYRRVEWDEQECSHALRAAKFEREKEDWVFKGIDQPLELKQLLANLSTYAIHESKNARTAQGKLVLLVPLTQKEFIHLVSLVYPHPASEDAARALWRHFISEDSLPLDSATHLGSSIAMLGRLNLRLRKQSHNSLIFRDPEQNNRHDEVMGLRKNQMPEDKAREILTGVMRLIDNNWSYDVIGSGIRNVDSANPLVSITTQPSRGRGSKGGLITLDALKLHPDGRVILAYVKSEGGLEQLSDKIAELFSSSGRIPVVAFTASQSLVDKFENPTSDQLRNARNFIKLYQLNSSEEDNLRMIGIPSAEWNGFKLDRALFSSAFDYRLRAFERSFISSVNEWRQRLSREGQIAYPLKPGGSLREDDRSTLFKAWRKLLIESLKTRSVSRLNEADEIKVEDLQSVLDKMAISPQARSKGYDEFERARLFDPLDDRAEPLFPDFLANLIERLLKGYEWTLDVAKKEWFWGYVWEGSTAREIYISWMSLACEIGYAVASNKGDIYQLNTLAALENFIQEAKNWLNNDYPQIVREMKEMFGEGRVDDIFAPLGQAKVGSQTNTAIQRLEEAEELLQRLQVSEGNFERIAADGDTESVKQLMIDSARKRLQIIEKVEQVFNKNGYDRLVKEESIHTLSFEDQTSPLWKRIKRAKLFIDDVREIESKIKKRIDELREEMRAEVSQIPGFPFELFTRSFEKIRNILEGALSHDTPQGATQSQQQTEPGTLGHYIRDLRAGDARNKLAQLGREVGLDVETMRITDLKEIDGAIVNGFNRLKTAYEQQTTNLENQKEKLANLEAALKDAPEDFFYPDDTPTIDDLRTIIAFTDDTLADIRNEEVERLHTEFETPARLGSFRTMMEAAQSILAEPKRAIDRLSGHLITIDNKVKDYRQRLLNGQEIRQIERGLNTLLHAQGKPQRLPLDMQEIEAAVTLRAAKAKRDERRSEWVKFGEAILRETGASFAQWQQIVADLDDGRTPKVEDDRALVEKGFLVRSYRLGGLTQ